MPQTAAATDHSGLDRVTVIVPARESGPAFVALVEALADRGFGAIILVDDGSSATCFSLFARLLAIPAVHLVRHSVNLGKGRALKTGINYLLLELPQADVMVTADADGQHTPTDIVRVAQAALAAEGRVVLGARHFDKTAPLRSRFGNAMTRCIFGFVTGSLLDDTQTGLRAFPRAILPSLMLLDGERYEYEMTVLAHICRTGEKPLEVPIETVYIDGNKSSHFDPIRDSMRIYFVLARFFASSTIASGIDWVGFTLAFAATHNILVSVLVGRLSSLVNFVLNKRFVFQSRRSIRSTLLRYYLLVPAIATLSYVSIWALTRYAHWNVFAAKVMTDILLSLVSFSVQQTFVFRRGEGL